MFLGYGLAAFRNPQVAAPLKRAFPSGGWRTPSIFPQPSSCGSIEAIVLIGRLSPGLAFRNPKVAAPLKPNPMTAIELRAMLSATLKLRLH